MDYNISGSIIRFGLILIALGLLLKILPGFHFSPLPGDIIIEKKNFTLYLPIVTCIVLSLFLTLMVNIFFRK